MKQKVVDSYALLVTLIRFDRRTSNYVEFAVWDLRFSQRCCEDSSLLEYGAVSLGRVFFTFIQRTRACVMEVASMVRWSSLKPLAEKAHIQEQTRRALTPPARIARPSGKQSSVAFPPYAQTTFSRFNRMPPMYNINRTRKLRMYKRTLRRVRVTAFAIKKQ